MIAVRVVVATANTHKLDELRQLLPGIELTGLDGAERPREDGGTYEANARIKARWARGHAPKAAWALGEDSGLEAHGLGGRPGVHSARWADDGVACLLSALEGVVDRGARYRCTIVAIAPDGREAVAEGTLDGRIEGPPRGDGGFGYDPVFVPSGEVRTVAELGDQWKREHSHRARAAGAIAALLHDS